MSHPNPLPPQLTVCTLKLMQVKSLYTDILTNANYSLNKLFVVDDIESC